MHDNIRVISDLKLEGVLDFLTITVGVLIH